MEGKECKCSQEGQIAQIRSELKIIKGIVMGNGQPGLHETVIKLSSNIEAQTIALEALKTAVNGLLKFQNEQYGTETGKMIVRRRNAWIFTIFVTAIVSLITALVFSLIS